MGGNNLKNFHWILGLYAFLAVLSMCSVGVGIALGNTPLVILAVLGIIVFMGLGFTRKKKLRESGLL